MSGDWDWSRFEGSGFTEAEWAARRRFSREMNRTFAKPVRLQQTKHHLQLIDANGECIAEMGRHAWSSNDRTLQETIECRNFIEGREEASAANARQIAQFEEMVSLINGEAP